jgi:hypothetical protein
LKHRYWEARGDLYAAFHALIEDEAKRLPLYERRSLRQDRPMRLKDLYAANDHGFRKTRDGGC